MPDYDKILAAARAKQGKAQASKAQESAASLDQIKDRSGGDTRPLTQVHVEELAESISVLGLIEPIVVDIHNRLLAGGHRRAAIQLLKEQQAEKYQKHFPEDQVPVRVMPFDSEEEPELALAIEAAENEKRRDYTPAEVKAIAERLKAAGYEDVKGRPRKGQKPLMPALSVVVGKHLRTVQRYLNESTTDVVLFEARSPDRNQLLRQALTKLEKWQQGKPKTKQEKMLAERMPEFLALISSVVDEE